MKNTWLKKTKTRRMNACYESVHKNARNIVITALDNGECPFEKLQPWVTSLHHARMIESYILTRKSIGIWFSECSTFTITWGK